MTTQNCPMCLLCARYDAQNDTCTAFPKGIPQEIMVGRFDHRKPYPGDKGLTFKPGEGVTDSSLEAIGYGGTGDEQPGAEPAVPAGPAA